MSTSAPKSKTLLRSRTGQFLQTSSDSSSARARRLLKNKSGSIQNLPTRRRASRASTAPRAAL